MELLVRALQIAFVGQEAPFVFRQESRMHRRGLPLVAKGDQACRQRRLDRLRLRPRPGQQTGARGRGERHADLQFGVIAAAGALIGVGPTVVEDVFALGMRFQIAGRDTQNLPVGVLSGQVLGLPAGAGDCGLRGFER
jgi:hypothetical protein